MKVSTIVLLFVIGLLAFAEAAPGPKGKPSPKNKPKPKPKPKRKSHTVMTAYPTQPATGKIAQEEAELVQASSELLSTEAVTDSIQEDNRQLDHAGFLVVLVGAAVACVVAMVAVVRAPSHPHEALPQSSEHAAV